jgi:putative IMPACT (imprinted ancient) family translation regulator
MKLPLADCIVCRQVLEELYQNRKIVHATHNMYAYRICKEDTKCCIQDCNDDGEAQAGSRLLHLLQVYLK